MRLISHMQGKFNESSIDKKNVSLLITSMALDLHESAPRGPFVFSPALSSLLGQFHLRNEKWTVQNRAHNHTGTQKFSGVLSAASSVGID